MKLQSRARAPKIRIPFRWSAQVLVTSAGVLSLVGCGSRVADTDSQTSTGSGPGAAASEVDAGSIGGPTSTEPAKDSFWMDTYLELSCNLYTRCSAELRRAYGTSEQCLRYLTKLYEQPELQLELPTFAEPVWDAQCLADLAQLDCPPGDAEDVLALQQHLIGGLFACARPELIGCNDRDDCLELWECSATDGACGSCQRSAPGTCGHHIECSGGDHCVDGICSPPTPMDGACTAPQECTSNRCDDGVCVPRQSEGDSCSATTDCGPYLWCDRNICVPPAAPGERCAEGVAADVSASCQNGFVCHDGRCTEVELSGVAVGQPCSLFGSCVAGAECLGSTCVETDVECVGDDQCPAGHYCDTECLPKMSDGMACNSDRACVSNHCSDEQQCADGNPCD